MTKPKIRAPLGCKRVGLLGVLLFLGLAAGEALRGSGDGGGLFADPTGGPLAIIYLGAAALFVRRGFFRHRGTPKLVVLVLAVAVSELASTLAAEEPRVVVGPAFSCAAVSCLLICALARSRVLAAFVAAKEVLSLERCKLSTREQELVRERMGGKSTKGISYELHISDSTVRNILSKAYHKLGIRTGQELAALGERYRIE